MIPQNLNSTYILLLVVYVGTLMAPKVKARNRKTTGKKMLEAEKSRDK